MSNTLDHQAAIHGARVWCDNTHCSHVCTWNGRIGSWKIKAFGGSYYWHKDGTPLGDYPPLTTKVKSYEYIHRCYDDIAISHNEQRIRIGELEAENARLKDTGKAIATIKAYAPGDDPVSVAQTVAAINVMEERIKDLDGRLKRAADNGFRY